MSRITARTQKLPLNLCLWKIAEHDTLLTLTLNLHLYAYGQVALITSGTYLWVIIIHLLTHEYSANVIENGINADPKKLNFECLYFFFYTYFFLDKKSSAIDTIRLNNFFEKTVCESKTFYSVQSIKYLIPYFFNAFIQYSHFKRTIFSNF